MRAARAARAHSRGDTKGSLGVFAPRARGAGRGGRGDGDGCVFKKADAICGC